ncbi:helix-turn-helix transcriptional regulator [bacterium]|nr:helix-turn-helix transcriptional regulator [bacterium]PIV82192.1 MAG: transcriptional regulator [bacterium CG17_big_fil_post_rev_8_21_14_2_50_64_8]PJA75530.1 MAG: transcriptional regulator [bacterium CG_4_9_14_3_um_filter_65_15]
MSQPDHNKRLLTTRAEVFKALGHPTRLAIVDMLAGGERCVCEINQHIDADMSTVSRHLAVLRNVGILSSDKRGNQVFYRLECPCITAFYGCLESVIGGSGGTIQLEASR